ncbi:hypothetical protein HNP84_001079 [Thermocatellispora tengchongensis]|uniref:Uncharacterized protein n=1 Tax=Thermocatellispora tengchongensis TaxID=1073253 RepID=A0A840P0A7_9ACTN|nr:hypothetical protein [Thermocatellispora tengchongensis]
MAADTIVTPERWAGRQIHTRGSDFVAAPGDRLKARPLCACVRGGAVYWYAAAVGRASVRRASVADAASSAGR